MTLALFDLDHTLINGDSDHSWGEFLVNKELVDAEEYRIANDHFYDQYKDGTLDIREYNRFALKFLSENTMETLNTLHQTFMQERILPIISDKVRELIANHRNEGHTLVIVTATNSFVTRPIATELGIEHLLAIEPKIVDGHISRELEGVPTFREGKVTRLKQWLEDRDETLEGSYFYSDSHNDLPLLNIVDNPVAVNPDSTLLDIADKYGWPVIDLHS
uniref:Phosphoserine phosphatase (EC) n=1 Tax=uncultured Thiotrichaceae bacterium TaxID=298394 RepID=A0A6S6UM03_9GAMM|nr:MAG: Phosphoserine phosphatase (EC [uncultured Thiotrichaceae bacterium]